MIEKFKLEHYFNQPDVNPRYMLGGSDCESMTLGDLLALDPHAEMLFKTLWLGYTESMGDHLLRKEIAQLHFKSTFKDIIVFSGGEEPIYIFIRAFLKPEDHVIVTSPYYQSYTAVAKAHGCQVSEWQVPFDLSEPLPFSDLNQKIQKNTRALIVNFPHNPTGYLPSKTDFAKLMDIAKEHNLLVLSDEVYRYLERNPEDRLPVASDLYSKAVSVGVMTKAYGLGGLRIGWASCLDEEMRSQMVNYRHYTSICNSGPSEFLATLALRHADTILSRNNMIIDHNLEMLEVFFERYPLLEEWIPPKSSPVAFPRLAPGLQASEVCKRLLQEAGVLILPSTVFNAGEARIRIGFGRKHMDDALEVLGQWIESSQILG